MLYELFGLFVTELMFLERNVNFCKNNWIIHIQHYPPVFSPVFKGPSPRRSRAMLVRGGHVTGIFAGGSREGLQRGRQSTIYVLRVRI